MQQGNGPFHAESRFTGISRVEVQDLLQLFGKRLMRMAEDHDVGPMAGNGAPDHLRGVMGSDDVMDQKLVSRELNDVGLGIIEARVVGVARYSCDWRDFFQFQKDTGEPDVARMQNVRHPLEEQVDARIEEVVRVRNNANSHGVVTLSRNESFIELGPAAAVQAL